MSLNSPAVAFPGPHPTRGGAARHAAIGSAAVLAALTGARAQFATSFESPPYAASAAGTLLTGQDGWQGSPAGLNGFYAFSYAGNSVGLPANLSGGAQFAAGISGFPGASSAESRHPVDFSRGGRWAASWDVAMAFTGTAPSTSNIQAFGPFGGSRTWATRAQWTDATATAWDMLFLPFDAAGNAFPAPTLPGAGFGGLLPNHWYRESVTWSFDSNLIESVSVTDLGTGGTVVASPSGWYLGGGASPAGALPTLFRALATGSLGTVSAIDNLAIAPIPSAGAWVVLIGAAGLAVRRRR